MDVRECCIEFVAVAYRSLVVSEAARLMSDRHVGCLVVIEERPEGKMPVGILTDRDIVMSVVAKDLDPRTIPVGEVMSADLVAVREGDSIKDALALMRRRGVRRAPCVTKNGMLVGIVTLDDILRKMISDLDDVAAAISSELAIEVAMRSSSR